MPELEKILGDTVGVQEKLGGFLRDGYLRFCIWTVPYPPTAEATAAQSRLIEEDIEPFTLLSGLIRQLIADGNFKSTDQASVLIALSQNHLAGAVKERVFGQRHAGWNPDDSEVLSYFLKELEQRTEVLEQKEKGAESALGYSGETIQRLADVVSSLPPEDFIPLEVGITTHAAVTSGRIEVGKDKVQASFSLPDFGKGVPDSPLAGLAQKALGKPDQIREEAIDLIKVYKLSYVPAEYLDDEARRWAKKSFFVSDVVAETVNPKNPREKATLVYHDLAAPGVVSEAAAREINQDLAKYLETTMRSPVVGTFLTSQATEGGESYPVVLVNTRKANYRITVRPTDGHSQLLIESVSAADKHKNSRERTEEGLKVIDEALRVYHSYVNAPILNPGLIVLQPELEKMAHVDFEELTERDLLVDLGHIGGFPELTNQTINHFVSGTIHYSEGKTRTKPNSLILVGETGSGKTTTIKAICREFFKVGIPVYTIASSEKRTPENLIKALITFQRDEKGGVFMLEDVEHGYLEGPPEEVNRAQATLLRVTNELSQSPNHVVIINTEHPERIIGGKEALLQTHRFDVVVCKIESNEDALEDLLRGTVARLLTTDLASPLAKDDEQVSVALKRLSGDLGINRWVRKLVKLAGEYYQTAPLTGGVLDGGFKAASWESTNFEVIFDHLKRILEQKGITRILAQEAQTGKEITAVRKEMDGLVLDIASINEQLGLVTAGTERAKMETAALLGAQDARIAGLEAMIEKLTSQRLAIPGGELPTAPPPPGIHRIGRREVKK